MSIRLEGLDRALAALDRQSGPDLQRRVVLGLRAGASTLTPAIRRQSPVRTGKLRRSVSVRSSRGGSVSVGPRAWYRHFVIRGTSRGIRPNPFVDRGVDADLPTAVNRVADVILRGQR